MGLYDLYDSQQRKVFWKKARNQVKKDLKKDWDTYGEHTGDVLDHAINYKKIWQEPERLRLALYNIFADINNIKDQDIEEIRKQYKIKDKEAAISMFQSRLRVYFKIGD